MAIVSVSAKVETVANCTDMISKVPKLKEERDGTIELYNECVTDQDLVMSGWITPSRPVSMNIILRVDAYAAPKMDASGEIMRGEDGGPLYSNTIVQTYKMNVGKRNRAKYKKIIVSYDCTTKEITANIK